MSTSSHDFPLEENPDEHKQTSEEGEYLPPTIEAEEGETVEVVSSEPTSMEELPPEAQGETNGGPLGCCLGITVGILLSLVIAVISRIYPDLFVHILGEQLSIVTRVLMALILIVGAIIFGTLGWRIGKRFYREYEPSPRYVRKMALLEERERAIARRRRRRRKGN